MRIIAGQWRGRRLAAPAGEKTRPTADRTRERLFSMLESRLGGFDDLRVLDLFAGTGALGLEALSRGAGHVTFVEQDRDALKALRQNIATLGADDRCDVRHGSVYALGMASAPYDLILLDPPYGHDHAPKSLSALAETGWFAPYAWIAAETARDESLSLPNCTTEVERPSGKALLHILRAAK